MEKFIARENIKRFRARLEACSDPEQKAVLSRLLENEEQRLQEVLGDCQNLSAPTKECS